MRGRTWGPEEELHTPCWPVLSETGCLLQLLVHDGPLAARKAHARRPLVHLLLLLVPRAKRTACLL